MNGLELVLSAMIYTTLVAVGAYFVGKNNKTTIDKSTGTVNAELQKLSDTVNANLTVAKADVAKVSDVIASVEVKPEAIVSAIEAEIKKVA
jgi:hypothetical protein